MAIAKTFEELKEKRQKFIDAAEENNALQGLVSLLTELYPDEAHFIYELLQNAEDAQASEVCFQLYKNGLVFKHNGQKQFTLEDVEAITNIGHGTKKDDPTTIGKFGVGFKKRNLFRVEL